MSTNAVLAIVEDAIEAESTRRGQGERGGLVGTADGISTRIAARSRSPA